MLKLNWKHARFLRRTIFVFVFGFSMLSCGPSQKVVNESGTKEDSRTEQSSVVYSEFCEITGGNVSLYVRDKNRITCGTNHIFFKVDYVNPEDIIIMATGGALMLEDAHSRTYTFRTNCRSERNGISLAWRQSDGKTILLAKMPLDLEKKE